MNSKNNMLELRGFRIAAEAGLLFSRDYAGACLKLLMNYNSISASEAASRLELHIRTVQDFLEGLTGLGILKRESVQEDKRPYYRYSMPERLIRIEFDPGEFLTAQDPEFDRKKIREMRGSGAVFHEGKDHSIRSVTVYSGTGRNRVPSRISLTKCQGRFLFHLPFPTQSPMTIKEIISRADIVDELYCGGEVRDIVNVLIRKKVIDVSG